MCHTINQQVMARRTTAVYTCLALENVAPRGRGRYFRKGQRGDGVTLKGKRCFLKTREMSFDKSTTEVGKMIPSEPKGKNPQT